MASAKFLLMMSIGMTGPALMGALIGEPVAGTTARANTTIASPNDATQSLEEIRKAASDFVLAHLPAGPARHHVEAGRLDARLRLRACRTALQTFAQNPQAGGARTTVGVRCVDPAWTLYVSVATEVETSVLVLRHALPRQSAITPEDVESQSRRLPGSSAAFVQDLAALQGMRLKRAIPAGTALTMNMLTPDIVVRRGQQVTLLAASGPVEIRAHGQAMSDGGLSDRIRVQNLNSRRIVEGVVEGNGIVRVDL